MRGVCTVGVEPKDVLALAQLLVAHGELGKDRDRKFEEDLPPGVQLLLPEPNVVPLPSAEEAVDRLRGLHVPLGALGQPVRAVARHVHLEETARAVRSGWKDTRATPNPTNSGDMEGKRQGGFAAPP